MQPNSAYTCARESRVFSMQLGEWHGLAELLAIEVAERWRHKAR